MSTITSNPTLTGLIVLAVALLAATAFGLYRRSVDGAVRPVLAGTQSTESLKPWAQGRPTVIQFSSEACAPCHATRRMLSGIAAKRPHLSYVELDAADHLDLVKELGITRTPTVLLLDDSGSIRHRISGAPAKAQLLTAIDQIAA